jgi:serine protease inhibitor
MSFTLPHRALCFLAFGMSAGLISAADVPVPIPAAPPPAPAAPAAPAPAPEDPLIASVVESSNAFAADLYAQLRTEPGNVAFAPLGLVQALLPIAAGTQGAATDELRRALHLSQPVAETADGFAALTRRLQRAAGNETNLVFARALWVQQWNSINDGYIDLIRQHCRSELRVIDFARPEYAVHWMNRWIADRTEDRITAIADVKSYDPASCIVVANGVFFRTAWQRDFDPTLTELAAFTLPPPAAPVSAVSAEKPAAAPSLPSTAVASAQPAGASAPTAAAVGAAPISSPGREAAAPSVVPVPAPKSVSVEVPTMRQLGLLRTVAQPGFRLVELPYRNEHLALVVLLPDADSSLAQIEPQLSATKIAECLRRVRAAEPGRIELRLPRFRAERALAHLGPAFAALGVKTLFDRGGAADFALFGGNPDGAPLYLSAVSHLVKIAVDEKGAAVAAATTTSGAEAPYDAPVAVPTPFTVDRPFLFFICDQQSGALLFMGRIVDPRAG